MTDNFKCKSCNSNDLCLDYHITEKKERYNVLVCRDCLVYEKIEGGFDD